MKDRREGQVGHMLLERLPGQGYSSDPLREIKICKLAGCALQFLLGPWDRAPFEP